MRRKVAITGLGCLTPIGNTVEETWQSVVEGKCGIDKITRYDTSDRKVKLAGELKGFNPDDYIDKREQRKMDLFTVYAVAASAQAMEDSGLLKTEEPRDRWGVIMASGIGGISTIEEEKVRGIQKGYDRVSPFFIPKCTSNMAAGNIALRFGMKRFCTCVVTACASGTNAIGDAARHIADGYDDVMIAGGAEASITELAIGGFTSLKALTGCDDVERASIPFDAERSGFVMGEGAGALVLEEYEHAKARGAKIYGILAGYGANCDAYHITAPRPDGSGAARCMQMAIEDAGITTGYIDYINAHGTSTKLNDAGETAAVKLLFGDDAKRIKMSSTKSMTGHLLGAAGAVEAVITTKAVEQGFLPPTIHYKVPDPACDLDVVPNKGYKSEIRYALSNSLGFGGHNATIVIGRDM